MEDQKIRWGIISTAKIARKKVIPGINKTTNNEVTAICSRDLAHAKSVASELGIPKAYGSYEELLEDENIDAVYNPLPNHLHVSWAVKAIEAGKHVLCEKPLGMDASDAAQLLHKSKEHSNLKVMEAFMYRFHPQWVKTKSLVDSGALGTVRTIQAAFTYHNVDANNIRNMADIGGGGLMDIGCYCISFSRFLFGEEPKRAVGLLDFDPKLKTDRIASGLLEYADGKSSNFTCSTQLMPYQRCLVLGTEGYIEIEIPVNAPEDQPTRLNYVSKHGSETITFDTADQYELQADAFAKSILSNSAVPTPLEDAVGNMKVIDAIFESGKSKRWINI